MAKIKEISIGGGLKLSIDYQTVDAHVTLTYQIDETDNPDQVLEEMKERLDTYIRSVLTQNYKRLKDSVDALNKRGSK